MEIGMAIGITVDRRCTFMLLEGNIAAEILAFDFRDICKECVECFGVFQPDCVGESTSDAGCELECRFHVINAI